jgi:hypothetical protein
LELMDLKNFESAIGLCQKLCRDIKRHGIHSGEIDKKVDKAGFFSEST